MEKFEYKIILFDTTKKGAYDFALDKLNEFGCDGWEVVSQSEDSGCITYTLKRKI